MNLRGLVSLLICLPITLLPVGPQRAQAAPGDLLFRLDNPTPIFNERYGRALTEFQGNLLVGASGDILDSGQANRFGAIYEYAADGQLLRRISNADPVEEAFGVSLDVNGDLLLVGAVTQHRAYLLDGSNGLSGIVIPNASPNALSLFGNPVRFAGDLQLIGAPLDDYEGFFDAGHAYLMDGPVPVAEFRPEVLEDFLAFGRAMAGRPGLVAIGNPRHTLDELPQTGQVELFDADPVSASFGQRIGIVRPEIDGVLVATERSFGHGVAFDGDRMIISEGGGGSLWVYQLPANRDASGNLVPLLLTRFAGLSEATVLTGAPATFGDGIDARGGVAIVGALQEERADEMGRGVATLVVYDPAHPLFGFRTKVNMPDASSAADKYAEVVLLQPEQQRFVVAASAATLDGQTGAGSVFVHDADFGALSGSDLPLLVDPLLSQVQAQIFVPGLPPQIMPLTAAGAMQGRLVRDPERPRAFQLKSGQIGLDNPTIGPFSVDLVDLLVHLVEPGSPAEVDLAGEFSQTGNGIGFSGEITAMIFGEPQQQDVSGLELELPFHSTLSEPNGNTRVDLPLQFIIPVDVPGPADTNVFIVGTIVLVSALSVDELFANGFED